MHSLTTGIIIIAATVTAALASPTNFVGPMPHNFISRFKKSMGLQKRAEGGVQLCTGIDFTGHCDYVVWPRDECIALNDYAGSTYSFRPDEGNECFLMQGRCNANEQYASIKHDDDFTGHLSGYPWIRESESYVCYEDLSSNPANGSIPDTPPGADTSTPSFTAAHNAWLRTWTPSTTSSGVVSAGAATTSSTPVAGLMQCFLPEGCPDFTSQSQTASATEAPSYPETSSMAVETTSASSTEGATLGAGSTPTAGTDLTSV